ncbi:MAG: metallophosphoesterase [Bacteroidota bacterium]
MKHKVILFVIGLFCFPACIPSPPSSTGQIISETEPGLRFMVSADPQYHWKDMLHQAASVRNANEIAETARKKIKQEAYRGYVIAGDLTHHARDVELAEYLRSIDCISEYVYDGLGNHDFTFDNEPLWDEWKAFGLSDVVSAPSPDWRRSCYRVWDIVRQRRRQGQVSTDSTSLHYSWDWQNVHFVHLNLYPGNQPQPFKMAQNPFRSLAFLRKDLSSQVGQSGRPVILIHHYGFDDFSTGLRDGIFKPLAIFWNEVDRKTYWELLQSYNVMAIFTGHAHDETEWFLPWDGQNIGETKVSGDVIPTFIAGAARDGYYLDCQIIDQKLIVRRFRKGQQIDQRVVETGMEYQQNRRMASSE